MSRRRDEDDDDDDDDDYDINPIAPGSVPGPRSQVPRDPIMSISFKITF